MHTSYIMWITNFLYNMNYTSYITIDSPKEYFAKIQPNYFLDLKDFANLINSILIFWGLIILLDKKVKR